MQGGGGSVCAGVWRRPRGGVGGGGERGGDDLGRRVMVVRWGERVHQYINNITS